MPEEIKILKNVSPGELGPAMTSDRYWYLPDGLLKPLMKNCPYEPVYSPGEGRPSPAHTQSQEAVIQSVQEPAAAVICYAGMTITALHFILIFLFYFLSDFATLFQGAKRFKFLVYRLSRHRVQQCNTYKHQA